jgi:hypothetical protein
MNIELVKIQSFERLTELAGRGPVCSIDLPQDLAD